MCRAVIMAKEGRSSSVAGATENLGFGSICSKSKHRDAALKHFWALATLFSVSVDAKSSLLTDDSIIIFPFWINVVAQNSLRGGAKKHRETPEILRSVSWDDLRVFLSCAEQSSFRKAAKLLKINSATIVRRIERLEQVIGSRLFVRHTDGVSVTAEGRMIMEHARTMERATFNIVRQSQISLEGIRGLVRVAITEGLGTVWVLPRLLEFQKANRYLTFELQQTMELTDVGRLQADISIQFRRPERPDLVAVQLGYLHSYPFVSESYKNSFGVPKTLSELKLHRVVQQLSPQLEEGVYERVLGVESLEGIVGVRTNSGSAVLYAVERGAGIGFLPNYALALGAKLVPIDIGMNHRLDIWMTYHPDLRNSYRHMLIIDWLRQIFDGRRFPCFDEKFIHPHDLIALMTDSAKISNGEGFAAANPLVLGID
jgi:DNA-binding transcriptional LysR family regulator